MHQAKNLTWKQERFVSEYLLSGNAAEAVRRAGYQTRYPSDHQRRACVLLHWEPRSSLPNSIVLSGL